MDSADNKAGVVVAVDEVGEDIRVDLCVNLLHDGAFDLVAFRECFHTGLVGLCCMGDLGICHVNVRRGWWS